MGARREPEVGDLGDEARARVGPHEHVGRLEVVRVRRLRVRVGVVRVRVRVRIRVRVRVRRRLRLVLDPAPNTSKLATLRSWWRMAWAAGR